jgi:hypothetical protein
MSWGNVKYSVRSPARDGNSGCEAIRLRCVREVQMEVIVPTDMESIAMGMH